MGIQFRAVVIHLRATGDAPILKQAKFKVCFFFRHKSVKVLSHVYIIILYSPVLVFFYQDFVC